MSNIEFLPYRGNQNNIDIHPTAIIDENAELGENIKIGAFSIIGPDVKVGKNTIIESHVVINNSEIGENCKIFQGAIIGSESQDLKANKNEKSLVLIGNNNIIREYVTINRSSFLNGKTIIGDNNLLMAYSHVAHDCILGSHNILANSVNLGGHVVLGEHVVIGGLTGVHQFVRIGDYSMIGGLTRVNHDVPPFFTTVGNPAKVEGINLTGLKRNGLSRDSIKLLKKAHEMVFKSNLPLSDSIQNLNNLEKTKEIEYLVDFLNTKSKRGMSGLFLHTNIKLK